MTVETEFFKGDSSDIFSVKVYSNGVQVTGDDLSENYEGSFSLVKKLGLEPVLTKDMVIVEDSFRASVVPDESEDLATGNYIAVTEITKVDGTYRKEKHVSVAVRKQGVVVTP
jgi:hypothetical protein